MKFLNYKDREKSSKLPRRKTRLLRKERNPHEHFWILEGNEPGSKNTILIRERDISEHIDPQSVYTYWHISRKLLKKSCTQMTFKC